MRSSRPHHSRFELEAQHARAWLEPSPVRTSADKFNDFDMRRFDVRRRRAQGLRVGGERARPHGQFMPLAFLSGRFR